MTTTLDAPRISGNVLTAIEELKRDVAPAELVIEADGQGGARVRFGPVTLSEIWEQRETWMAGHITVQIPYADIYPVFVRGDLARADGKGLVAPLSSGHIFMGQPAVQVSRKSNRRDAAIETPKIKFLKVLHWINTQ